MKTAVGRRRVIFLALSLGTLGLFTAAMLGLILSGGMTLSEWLIGLGFMLTIPYAIIGFWNAAIGLLLLHVWPKSVARMPGVAALRVPDRPAPPDCDVALLMTLRNEHPAATFDRLERMRRSLAATGALHRFTFVVLSDTDKAPIIAEEEQAFERFRAQRGPQEPSPIYRRRRENRGYKAGNIAEFLDTRGQPYKYFIPLDSDSLMSGDVMVRLVAAMQRRPEIGILQSLVVGMPSASGFTRVFQFGMRHGMRVFTTGAAWWTADCGSYWGHNAVVRTAAFHENCRLPTLPGRPPLGGAILSHDQLEATYMRRAGYEVRVIPIESESYEINPPTLLDFIRRELRWCQGNMQYFAVLATPGLKPVSRLQLLIAIGMYLGQAAWIAMMAVGCIGSMIGDFHFRDLALGTTLFVGVFVLSIAPKLFGVLDVALTRHGARRYGGAARFGLSAVLEVISSMFMAPIVALSVALFMAGLIFHKTVTWSGQNRDRLDTPWRAALTPLAPHTAAGLALALALGSVGGWQAVAWGTPVIGGLALATPYAVLGARSTLGRWLTGHRLFAIPEERHLPAILHAPQTPPPGRAAPPAAAI